MAKKKAESQARAEASVEAMEKAEVKNYHYGSMGLEQFRADPARVAWWREVIGSLYGQELLALLRNLSPIQKYHEEGLPGGVRADKAIDKEIAPQAMAEILHHERMIRLLEVEMVTLNAPIERDKMRATGSSPIPAAVAQIPR